MDRVILLAIAGVLVSLIFGQIFKGGLGLLRIISIALVVFLMVLLSARPSNSPAILPSLAKRLFSENTIPAEASGEVLREESSITSQSAGQSPSTQSSQSFSGDDTLVSQTSGSAQAAFSGARTTASSTQIDPPTPVREFTTQSTTQSTSSSTPDERVASPQVESSSTSRQTSSYTPPSSASRPINALW